MRLSVQAAKEGTNVQVIRTGERGVITEDSRDRRIYLRSRCSWRVPVRVTVLLEGEESPQEFKVSDLRVPSPRTGEEVSNP